MERPYTLGAARTVRTRGMVAANRDAGAFACGSGGYRRG